MNLLEALRRKHLSESEVWALIPAMEQRLKAFGRPVPSDPVELWNAAAATLPERMEAECERMRAECAKLRAEIDAIPAEVAAHDAEIARLRAEIEKAHEAGKTLEAELATGEAELSRLNSKIAALQRQRDPYRRAASMVARLGIRPRATEPENPKNYGQN